MRSPFASWINNSNEITRLFLEAGQIPDLINLAGGLPEADTYPVAELADIASQAITQDPQDALNYSPIEGLPALRDTIADRFSKPHLKLKRENILIVTGGMQALDLIGKVLLDEGGCIAVQNPTYLGALDAWRPRYPKYVPMNLDATDFDPVVALKGTQFAYTVPNFSNPTGSLISTEIRRQLVKAANDSGSWLIEDDPYAALYYDGAPLTNMLEMSANSRSEQYEGPVIYMGTLSKEIAPGLRLGWVIAAPEMIKAMTVAKQGSDMCTSGLIQKIALNAINKGLLEKVLPKILSTYKSRRDALCIALKKHLSMHFTWQVPVGGMFVWAVARDPKLDTDVLFRRALEAGVCITPSSVFDSEGNDRSAMRINFTLNSSKTLDEGVRRLANTINNL
jgi:2-aminoadipate transaminase